MVYIKDIKPIFYIQSLNWYYKIQLNTVEPSMPVFAFMKEL